MSSTTPRTPASPRLPKPEPISPTRRTPRWRGIRNPTNSMPYPDTRGRDDHHRSWSGADPPARTDSDARRGDDTHRGTPAAAAARYHPGGAEPGDGGLRGVAIPDRPRRNHRLAGRR